MLPTRRIPLWAIVAFLAGFAILLTLVSEWFLIPAFQALPGALPAERHKLGAVARLLLAVVLFILLVGLVLTFRISRFLFPRPTPPREKSTPYVDAWAEAGKRMKTPPS